MYITYTLCTNIVPSLFVVFFLFVQTATAQLYNTQSDLCMRTPHLDRTGLLSTIVFSEKMTSHMVADTSLDFLHGSGAQFGEMETTDPHTSVMKIMESASLRCTYLSPGEIQSS